MKTLGISDKDLTKVITDYRHCHLRSTCQFVRSLLQDAALTVTSLVARQSSVGLFAQVASQGQPIRSLGGSTTQNVGTPQVVNVHFMTPQSVSNLFVGRKLELLQWKQDLEGRGTAQCTMRVVVYGLNGSGKTQFCCKFAQDNRSR